MRRFLLACLFLTACVIVFALFNGANTPVEIIWNGESLFDTHDLPLLQGGVSLLVLGGMALCIALTLVLLLASLSMLAVFICAILLLALCVSLSPLLLPLALVLLVVALVRKNRRI